MGFISTYVLGIFDRQEKLENILFMMVNINQMVIQNLAAEIIQLMTHTHQLKGSKTI